MTANENMDNRFARSSIRSCSGVFFSSTYAVSLGKYSRQQTHILHHREDHSKFGILASPDDDTRTMS